MTEFSYSTAGLLFPAISLLMLAYTNRFLGIASLARQLADRYQQKQDPRIKAQVVNLKQRILLLRHTQGLGLFSLFLCTTCMLSLLLDQALIAKILFGLALLFMLISLSFSLREIHLSVRAINLDLNRCFENQSE